MQKSIGICDTTLRDGEQMPGVVFSPREKLRLAEKIADFGCDTIELMPSVSDSEMRVTRRICKMGLNAEITASTMMRKDHVQIALDCGVDSVTLFSPISDLHMRCSGGISREANITRSAEMVDYCREQGLKVNFAGSDAARADRGYLMDFMRAIERKVKYFLPCDTLGSLTPFETYSFIREIKEHCRCKIALHGHNDFGMATANTIAGLHAGADAFSGTFCGIGERAGNVPIEEVCAALKYIYDIDLGLRYRMTGDICRMVEKFSGMRMQAHKPLVGKNAFSHESGIHVDAILKDTETYEVFDPSDIGMERKLVFGKHNGKAILRHMFKGKITEGNVSGVMDRVKRISEAEKRSLSRSEVMKILRGVENGRTGIPDI